MVGGYCFLIGTCLFYKGPVEFDQNCQVTCFNYNLIMALWVMGSTFFSFGGCSLAYRHMVMNLT